MPDVAVGQVDSLNAVGRRSPLGSPGTGSSLDLSPTVFVDSSGLGALVSGLKTARRAGGDLRIVGPGEQVREHGEPTGQVTFSFTLTVQPDRLVCLLDDSSSRPVPAMSERVMPDDPDLEDGRGLALAQAALDVMECRQDDGLNRWTLVRLRH